MQRAAAAEPAAFEGHFGLGVIQRALGQLDDAAASFQRGLEADPAQIEGLLHLADLRMNQGNLGGAEVVLRLAIAGDDQCIDAWSHLGMVAVRQGRNGESLEAFQRAVQLEHDKGESADSFVNLGINLRDAGRVREALDLYEANLREHPSVDGYFGYAVALMQSGRLPWGWHFFEFRWLRQPSLSMRPRFAAPIWNGQPLAGKMIFLRPEQGIGDVFQFVRYAPALKAMGATVNVGIFSGLGDLLRGVEGVDHVLEPTDAVQMDYYVPVSYTHL